MITLSNHRYSVRFSLFATSSKLAACVSGFVLVAAPASAQETDGPPSVEIPERPETPVRPFDVIATSGGFNGGLNDVLRFNGETGEFIGSFPNPETVPDIPDMDGVSQLNDPRDVVLTGSPFDPETRVLINTGFAPPMEGNDQTVMLDLEGNFIGTFANLGDAGSFVDPGGAVFGPGGDFFVGSRTEGTVFQYDGETGAFVPTDFIDGGGYYDPADIDFPRGFVFDGEDNLYIGNGANPVTGAGQNSILLVDPVTRELTLFSAPVDFSPLDVILSPDGTRLVVSSENPFTGGSLAAAGPGSIFVFDLATGEVEQILSPTNADGSPAILAPRGLGFAPDGTLFSSSTGNGTIFRFDIETGEFLGTFAQIFTSDADGNIVANINAQALNFVGVFADCAGAASAVTCGRGIDFDGVSDTSDGLSVSLASDAFLEGSVDLGGADSTVNLASGATVSVLDDRGLDLGMGAAVTNAGFVESENNDAIRIGSGSTLTNSGFIVSNGGDAVEAAGASGSAITNTGTIYSAENGNAGIAAGDDLAIENSGTIVSLTSNAIALGSGSITNSGMITNQSDGSIGAVTFTGSSEGAGGGTLVNLSTGIIMGGTGVGTSSSDAGAQQVFNAGTITGEGGVAASLGDGSDLFEQQLGASVGGNIDLGAGDDTFRLLGLASSISGAVSGGAGIDTAELSGMLDADPLSGFENIDIVDATFVGDRNLSGTTTLVGNANFDLGSDTLSIDGDLILGAGSTITVTTSDGGLATFENGPVTIISETGSFTDNGATVNVIDDDFFVDYVTSFGSVMVTPVAAELASASGDENFTVFGAALSAAAVAGNVSTDLITQIEALGGSANIDDIAPALLPSLNAGIAREIHETQNIADDHIAARANSSADIGLWGEAFVRTADQDQTSLSNPGYDADAVGFTIGGDVGFAGSFRVGVAFSYASIDVDEETAPLEEADIDSFAFTGYLGWTAERAFVNASIGYSFSDVDTLRDTTFGIASGDFDVDGVRAQIFGGYNFGTDAIEIAPFVGLRYAELDANSYSEGGLLDLDVDEADAEFFEGRIGAQISTRETLGFGFRGRATYVYDFEDDPDSVSLTIPGSTAFEQFTAGSPDSRFEFAGGVDFVSEKGFSLALEYHGEFASDYESHAGALRARFEF